MRRAVRCRIKFTLTESKGSKRKSKVKQFSLFVVAVLVFLVSSVTWGADPECENPTQLLELDLSDGVGNICLPANNTAGEAVPDTKVITCSVTFVDGDGNTLSTQEVTGGPGDFLPLTVPRDGVGAATASCTMDGLEGAAAVVAVIFPSDLPPAPPVILE